MIFRHNKFYFTVASENVGSLTIASVLAKALAVDWFVVD
jgi:hypothetical protein